MGTPIININPESESDETNFDVMAKEILEFTPPIDVVRCINTLYKSSLPLDSKVVRLSTETNTHGKQRRSDIMLAVGERVFHAEIQRDHRSEVVFRMFDYGYRYAVIERIQHGDTLELNFPDPIVIYLNDKGYTPKRLNIKLNFTHADSFDYSIPAKRLGDYTPDELIDGYLYALCPFYPLKYETALSNEHDKTLEEQFAIETKSIINWIGKKVDSGTMDKGYATLLANALEKVLDKVKAESKIIDEEAMDEIMENVQTRKYVLDPLNWLAEGMEKGRAEERKKREEERLSYESNLKRMGFTPEQIAEAMRVD
jgi:hypothetical protein